MVDNAIPPLPVMPDPARTPVLGPNAESRPSGRRTGRREIGGCAMLMRSASSGSTATRWRRRACRRRGARLSACRNPRSRPPRRCSMSPTAARARTTGCRRTIRGPMRNGPTCRSRSTGAATARSRSSSSRPEPTAASRPAPTIAMTTPSASARRSCRPLARSAARSSPAAGRFISGGRGGRTAQPGAAFSSASRARPRSRFCTATCC